ncbi:MAG: serine/threonine protein kinase [Pyrinomonadaceae bacterium]|nr:serine/threonine protein kinase [Pyrinomonadaceae bacterium]
MSKDSSREDSGNSPDSADAPTRMIDSGRVGAAREPNQVSGQKPKNAGGDEAKPYHSARSSTSYDSIDDARFVPGEILAERYRIVGLLGKGGMGEVYRADDLKLGQAVALKFLPEHLTSDGAALARFHREVRVARQVSHKNVCRVYDIGEVDGRHFLSMEYIKGEELSSLLRRIGRIPSDKAIQLSRQICAGLAAAHDVGVLHRDLKPANVMIDGDGNARILDFGLAGLGEEFADDELGAGTPAYMAPEQIAGETFTVRSDIYSLGLLLYELFTAKRAFEAPTLGELIKLRRSNTTPTTPTSIIKDLDPVIERVIDRCIQTDPSLRPSSALQVAAALPGGDPIAAALAAGETPSPEMVAAAPTEGVLKPAVAAILLLAFVIGIALAAWLTTRTDTAVYFMTPLDMPPEALRARAREVVKKMGYPQQPLDSADGIILKDDYLRYIADSDQSKDRWKRLRTDGPGAYRFWYRQSPRYFYSIENPEVDRNPALDVSGMASLYLDMEGRLHWFIGVPPQREPPGIESAEPDWSIPFREAGLDLANFRQVASMSVPLHAYDKRAAWDGTDSVHQASNSGGAGAGVSTHVEAASFRGKIVYFETIYPWDRPVREEETPQSGKGRALTFILISIYMIVLISSVLLARKNLKLGRGDRRGATRLAFLFLIIGMLEWIFVEHHNWMPVREFGIFILSLAQTVYNAVFLWLLYVALEPFVRKRWPKRIISWSRLLAGGFRDPLVGRDILIGATFAGAIILLEPMRAILIGWLGYPPALTQNPGVENIGAHLFIDKFTNQISSGIFLGFISLFLLLLFFVVMRRERLAFGMLWALLTLLGTLLGQTPLQLLPLTALGAFLPVYVLYRFGLLASVATFFFVNLSIHFPITTELTKWYATDFTIALGICVALVVYAFYISLGGQKVFSGKLLEE